MKYGFDFYMQMSQALRKEWKREFKKINALSSLKDCYEATYSSFQEFVLCSFDWGETKKGFDYWERISDSKE